MILFDQNIFENIHNKTTKIFLWFNKDIFDWNQDWPQIGQFGPLCTALTTFDKCFLLWVGKQFCNFWLNLTSKTTRMRWHLWYHWNSSKVIILLNMNCVICIHILQFSQSILMERFKNKNHYVVRNAWLTRFRCCS